MRAAILKPKGSDFKSISDFNSEWSDRIAVLILVGLLVDIGDVFVPDQSFLKATLTIIANVLIMAGVWGELWFLKRARTADDSRVAQAEIAVAEAKARASEADRARAELEVQLRPRTLTEEQIDMIEGLRGKLAAVAIARETDAESHWFAQQIAMAFSAAGIGVLQYRRAPDIHTAAMSIYDPLWVVSDSNPKLVEPLVDIFRKTDPSLVIIGGPMPPPDIPAPPGIPIIIVGGRFALPPDVTIFSRLSEKMETSDANNRPQSANAKRE
jgi:hypothetical protein